MAVAIEELTPEAQAIAARLHPKVKEYLEQKAGREAAEKADKAAAIKAKSSQRQGGRASASRSQSSQPLDKAADFERQLNTLAPGRGISRSSAGGRMVAAVFVGIFVLEALSYMLGQPFSYNLKGAAQKVGDLSKTPYVPLYAGQSSPLASHGL
jgi:hypothetical protein